MTTFAITTQALDRRRGGLIGWAAALVSTVGLVVAAYPAVRGQRSLDDTVASLPPEVRQILGLSGGLSVTSPAGYLNSQFVTNLLPVLLLVFGVGMGAWAIAGDEARGTLALTLSTPIGRRALAIQRAAALGIAIGGLTVVTAGTLLALAPAVGLGMGLSAWHMAAGVLAAGATAVAYAGIAFGIGAATGSRTVAIGAASALAAGGYLIEGLSHAVAPLRGLSAATPWHWLIDGAPLQHGLTGETAGLPLAVAFVAVSLGITAFTRRDLR